MVQAGRKVKYHWTPEAKAKAAALWNRNLTAVQIAAAITKEFDLPHTKHTVQSLYRKEGAALGMINGIDKIAAQKVGRGKGPAAVRKPAGMVHHKVPKKSKQGGSVTVNLAEGTPFADLRKYQCRFSLTPSLPHLFCNCDAIEGRSWCEKHLEVIRGKKA